jgi:hypothetical protein
MRSQSSCPTGCRKSPGHPPIFFPSRSPRTATIALVSPPVALRWACAFPNRRELDWATAGATIAPAGGGGGSAAFVAVPSFSFVRRRQGQAQRPSGPLSPLLDLGKASRRKPPTPARIRPRAKARGQRAAAPPCHAPPSHPLSPPRPAPQRPQAAAPLLRDVAPPVRRLSICCTTLLLGAAAAAASVAASDAGRL